MMKWTKNRVETFVDTMPIPDQIFKEHAGFGSKITDSDLIHSVSKRGKVIASAFSSAMSQKDVENIIRNTVLDDTYANAECIADWMNDGADDSFFVLDKDYDKTVGRAFFCKKWHEWEYGGVPCDQVEVILRKKESNTGSFFEILAAYPRCSKNAIRKWRNQYTL